MPQLRAMIERLRKEADSVGLNMRRAVVAPGDPDILEVVFTVDPSLFATDEQREIDAQFADIEKQLETETRAERMKQQSKVAKTELEEWLEKDELCP